MLQHICKVVNYVMLLWEIVEGLSIQLPLFYMATGNQYEPCPQEDVSHFRVRGQCTKQQKPYFQKRLWFLYVPGVEHRYTGPRFLSSIRKTISKVSAQRGIELTTPEFEVQGVNCRRLQYFVMYIPIAHNVPCRDHVHSRGSDHLRRQ